MTIKLKKTIESNILEIEEGVGSAIARGAGALGGVLGGLASRVSREKRNWNKLVDEDRILRKKLDRRPDDEALRKREAFVNAEKIVAREKYLEVKSKYKDKASRLASGGASRTGHALGGIHRKIISS